LDVWELALLIGAAVVAAVSISDYRALLWISLGAADFRCQSRHVSEHRQTEHLTVRQRIFYLRRARFESVQIHGKYVARTDF